MAAVLQAHRLSKTFGSTIAVHDVSLSISAGECLAVLGPNGAGKTTTIEILEGLQQPTSGSVTILGKDIRRERRTILESVGVLLQETYMYKKLTVRETINLFGSFYRHPLSTDRIIQLMQLEEKCDSRLEHLSGGQKQRVYIGCALVNDPKLVFLDEPTTGLDPQARRMIWDLLKEYKGTERSILLTTHYMEEAEVLADRVAIMDHGRIIAEGSPRQLIAEICGEQIVWFSLESPERYFQLQERVPELAGAVAIDGGYEITTREAPLAVAKLTHAAQDIELPIRSLQMRNSTLEDVFLKLTGRSIRDD